MPDMQTVVGRILRNTGGFTGVITFQPFDSDENITFRVGYLNEALIEKYGRRVVAVQLITRNNDGHWYGQKIVPLQYDIVTQLHLMELSELVAAAANKEQV